MSTSCSESRTGFVMPQKSNYSIEEAIKNCLRHLFNSLFGEHGPENSHKTSTKDPDSSTIPSSTQVVMSTATKGHTVQSASQTKQDLNRNTKSDDETESVYSSTFARTRLLTTVFRESDNYSTNGTTVNYSTILLPIKDDTDAIHSKDEAFTAACSVIVGFVLVGVLLFFFMLKRRKECLNRVKNNDAYTEPVQTGNNYEQTESNKDVYDHVGVSPKIQVSENAYSFLRMTPQEKNNNANTEATFDENVYNCTLDLPMTCASVGDYDSFRKVAEGNDNVTYDTTITHINSTLVDSLYSSMNKCEQGDDFGTNTV